MTAGSLPSTFRAMAFDGGLSPRRLPIVPGHEIVGTVVARGDAVGERVGGVWMHDTCLHCGWSATGRENLCRDARFTGLLVHGGAVVCGGIHMSDIPSFPYATLWEERVIRSIANLTRADGRDFLALTAAAPLECTTQTFALADANEALDRLRDGRIAGAAVLDRSAAP
jgi:D-arabinose 1-dehydrogenase-like Zn-dependent alcohol dehydrogenase